MTQVSKPELEFDALNHLLITLFNNSRFHINNNNNSNNNKFRKQHASKKSIAPTIIAVP